MSSWAHSVESFPLSRVLPLYHCSLACKSVGTIVYARGGFGGHILSGRYQSFIPACNSTTVRGEMATLGRTADRFPEKLKCQTFEWKTDLCRHHVDQPPPLMLPTIPVHYHCVLPCKLFVSFDQSGTSGAHVFMGPLCGKLSPVQSAPSIPLLISLQKCGHYCICSGWLWGPCLLRETPKFYPCLQ